MGKGFSLFRKKKNESAEVEGAIEVLDNTDGNGNVESSEKKKGGAFSFLKHKFRIRLIRKNANVSDTEAAGQFENSGEFDNESPKGKKAPKVKKEKKPKPVKEKQTGEGAGEDATPKKIKPVLLIILIVAGVLAGLAVFFIISSRPGPTIEQQLLSARQLVHDEKYNKAVSAYQKILEKDDKLVLAYLGLADAMAGGGGIDIAIHTLTEALPLTDDNPDIQAKIEELTVALEAQKEEEAKAAEESKPSEESESAEKDKEDVESEKASDSGESEESTTDASSADSAPSAEPIVFKDEAFAKLLRQAIGKQPEDPVTEADLAAITTLKILGDTHAAADDSLHSINKNDGYEINGVKYTQRGTIKSLDDLSHLKKLHKLIIAYNSVADISGIEGLSGLETLGLYFNDIEDISSLSKLTGLKYLYIYDNQITDISPLSSLTGMDQLWLNKNHIKDISPVKNLVHLRELFISDNEVTDISAVSQLSGLAYFYADRNNISDISALKDLQSLVEVSFIDNPVTDLSPVSHVKNVNKPYLS